MAYSPGINEIVKCERSGMFPGVRDLIARSEKNNRNGKIPLHERLCWIENQIRSGALILYRVEREGELIGIVTGQVEREYGVPCNFLVLHAVSVEQQGSPFICTLIPLIHGLAQKSGIESWSVRSLRPGMDRRLEQHGFVKLETYYKRFI
ncbi:MAG: hypothetical protein JXR25_03110 [Pontiellaceae bacterium]|nr:hypothetical protein [Pontiellaceae bacterium]